MQITDEELARLLKIKEAAANYLASIELLKKSKEGERDNHSSFVCVQRDKLRKVMQGLY